MRWKSRRNTWRRKLVLWPLLLGDTWYWLAWLDFKQDGWFTPEYWREPDGTVHRFVAYM